MATSNDSVISRLMARPIEDPGHNVKPLWPVSFALDKGWQAHYDEVIHHSCKGAETLRCQLLGGK